jgi:hypothetical protein
MPFSILQDDGTGWLGGTDTLASSLKHGSKGTGHNVKIWFSVTYFK